MTRLTSFSHGNILWRLISFTIMPNFLRNSITDLRLLNSCGDPRGSTHGQAARGLLRRRIGERHVPHTVLLFLCYTTVFTLVDDVDMLNVRLFDRDE